MELDDHLYEQITALCAEGDKLFEKRSFDKALEHYSSALALVPNPKNDWHASVWINTALGDTYFFMKDFEKAKNAFYDAYNGPDATGNPFVNLRLGQCLFDLNEMEKAEDFLLRAYMLEGEDIFDSDNPKYLRHMRSKYDL